MPKHLHICLSPLQTQDKCPNTYTYVSHHCRHRSGTHTADTIKTCTHAHPHARTHTHTHTHTNVHAYTHIHVLSHTYTTFFNTHARVHSQTHTHTFHSVLKKKSGKGWEKSNLLILLCHLAFVFTLSLSLSLSLSLVFRVAHGPSRQPAN